MVRHAWRNQVNPSNVIVSSGRGNTTPSWIIDNVEVYVRKHVNFRFIMTTARLLGIWDLNTDISYYRTSNKDKIACFLSMRQILVNHVKMSDGHSLFAEIHQKGNMANVKAIIPNTPEAETWLKLCSRRQWVTSGNSCLVKESETRTLWRDFCTLHVTNLYFTWLCTAQGILRLKYYIHMRTRQGK